MPCFKRPILTAVTCLALALGAHAQQAAKQDKPKPPPIAVIKKADGKTVRGVVDNDASDGEQVTVKPVEGKSFGSPVELPWTEVKTISGGFTRERAHAAWKARHKAELCADCRGDRRLDCDTCKGTGHDPASSADCKTCKGELLVECPDKKCEAGKAPCPDPCLKLSEGTWTNKDGKRIRTFRIKGGTAWITDGHVGERYEVGATGITTTPCETCGKTGAVTCPTCGGDDKAPCPTCKANKTAADCATCELGKVACKTCGGSGLKTGAAPTPTAGVPDPSPAPAPAPADKPPAKDNNDGF